ncbi:MFS transporter [Pararhodobacter sp.]|uniref:MFS transporter n=1 Tax=Pararhodobacter sp. TaxID=2127056 RepID=UPI002FDED294
MSSNDGLPVPRRYWAVLAITIGIFMAVIDGVGINVALPAIAGDFGVDESSAIWVVTSYQLAVTISLFPLAALGDKLGYRKVYCGGLVVFVAASVVCAFAERLDLMIAARAVQGLGGSAVMTVNLALLRFIFPKAKLGRGIAYNTLVVAVSAAAGPVIAGAILSIADWHWLFLVNLPLGLLILPVSILALPLVPPTGRQFDFVGAALIALAIGIAVLTIDGLGRGYPLGLLTLGVLAGGGLGWAMVRHQNRSPTPMLAVDLLRIPVIRLSALTAVCAYVVQGLSYVSLPFHLHDTMGLPAAVVGLSMAPWPVGIMLASVLVGRLMGRHSAGLLGTLGLALLVGGAGCILWSIPLRSLPALVAGMFACGFGFGLFQSPNTMAIISGSPPARSAAASALQSSSRLVGQTVGAAGAAAIFGLAAAGSSTMIAITVAVVFAFAGMVFSSMRLLRS